MDALLHPPILSLIAWAIWISYWMWRARGVSESRWKESWLGRAQHLLPAFVGFHLMYSHAGFMSWPVLPAGASWPGFFLQLGGLFFTIWARQHLGAQWSGIITFKENHRLIRTGPYKLIRHPIYTGFITASFGSFMTRGLCAGLLGFILITSTFTLKLKREEKLLRKHFGRDYDQYRRESWALFPGIW
jgi:protein-S-isoprenylcysteine O-methyltransferase Ste14